MTSQGLQNKAHLLSISQAGQADSQNAKRCHCCSLALPPGARSMKAESWVSGHMRAPLPREGQKDSLSDSPYTFGQMQTSEKRLGPETVLKKNLKPFSKPKGDNSFEKPKPLLPSLSLYYFQILSTQRSEIFTSWDVVSTISKAQKFLCTSQVVCQRSQISSQKKKNKQNT